MKDYSIEIQVAMPQPESFDRDEWRARLFETACSEVDTLRSSVAALQAKLDEAQKREGDAAKAAVVMREPLGYIRAGLVQLGCPRVVDGVTGMNLRQQIMWSDALKLIDAALAASPECLKDKVLIERGAIEKGESICREADETNMRLEADLASARHDVEQLRAAPIDTPEGRAEWCKAHGLPVGWLLMTHEEIQTIKAELRAGTAWRSMETAPCDETEILILFQGDVFVVGQWLEGKWVDCWTHSELPLKECTAWQPLPSAPERSAAHGERLEGNKP